MASNRIYVGHLSYRARESDVEDFFSRYGRVREILLKNGFGFVEFDDPRDAEEAVYRANGKEIRGDRIVVEMTKRPPRGRDSFRSGSFGGGGRFQGRRGSPPRNPAFPYSQTKYKLRVKNLSSRVSWQDLKDTFRSVGEIMYADAHREKPNEGSVCFATYSDMKKAKEQMDGKDMNGRRIELVEVTEGRSRSRSRSRHSASGSRSKSRSRSRSRSSRSKSRSKSRSRSKSVGEKNGRTHSKSRSLSKSRSRSRSGSANRGAVNGDA